MKEEPKLHEESNREREKKKGRRGDKLQLVQEARMMPVEGMRAINRAFSQETAELSTHTHTHMHGIVKPACPDMLLCVCMCVGVHVCFCKCYQEVEDGDRRRWTIPLSVFTLSLNSRPVTEANGVLIYSWMTHTCLLNLPNRRVTSLCHICIYNIHSLFQ